MAQLGARFHGMEEVTGSIPVRSAEASPSIPKVYPAAFREAIGRVGARLVLARLPAFDQGADCEVCTAQPPVPLPVLPFPAQAMLAMGV